MQAPSSRSRWHHYLRLLLAATAIVLCLFVIRSAATFGFSRLLVTYSLSARDLNAAKRAVELAPNDAEAHFGNAVVLSMFDAPQQSVTELEQAVALRPADYTLWQQLGLLRDQTGNRAAALTAFDEAIKRAPFYSQPRWNRGNVLLRSGQYEAAFIDLNQAAQSNPELIPALLDLAWGLSRGDVSLTEQLAQIKGDKMRIAFAKLLARRGKAQEAMAQFGDAGNVPDAIKRELLDQLLAKGAFKEAFDVWQSTQEPQAKKKQAGPLIYDGGFEGSLFFDEGGFGWRVLRNSQATSILLDSSQPHSGSKCLRVEFRGNSTPSLSQLILLEPSKRYKINFASRSQDVVTGGLPFLLVSDASGDSKRLGQSSPLAKGTSNWQPYSFEFTTSPATTAIVLSLQRESCSTSPCPIFGSISLDSFSVEQLR
ncbi:MAG: carbohydrate binding domain-containing protein [Pyrinomonadaceae bacterium]